MMEGDPHTQGTGSRLAQRSVRDVYYVLFRHARPAALAFFGVLVLVVVFVLSRPQSYRSEARLMVRLGRESVSLDPTASTGKIVSVSQSRLSEINSELEIIQSRDLLAAVAVATLLPTESRESPWPESTRNEAALELAERLRVESLEDTNIIRIAYDDTEPQRARAVLTELIVGYLERHIDVHRTPGAYEFFSEQVAERADKVRELEFRIRDLKNESGITSIDAQRTGLLERAHARTLELEDQRAELAGVEAERESADLALPQVSELKAELASIAAELAGVTDGRLLGQVAQPAAAQDQGRSTESLRIDLNALRIEEEDLVARFTDAYPPLQSVRSRIARASKLLESALAARQELLSSQLESKRAVTEARIESHLAAFSARLDARRTAALARIDVLQDQVDSVRRQLERLNGQEIALARLTNELEGQRANYSRYAESLEQARIDQALQDQQISNISLVQPATLPIRPHGASRAFLVALGLILAVMAGAGVALSLELLDDSIHSPAMAEERLQLPVLAALPRCAARLIPDNLSAMTTVDGVSSFTTELSLLCDQLRAWRSSRSRAFPSSAPESGGEISKGVLRVRPGQGPNSAALLAITSCEIGSGVSTVSSYLAASLARDGGKVLLVKTLGHLNGNGSNGRANGSGLEASEEVSSEGVSTRTLDLSKLDRGAPSNVDELLWRLRSGAQSFEFVILDLPQISGMDSTTRLAALSDGVVLVVGANNTRWQAAERAKRVLVKAQANVLGTVINRRQFPIPEWLYAKL